MAMLNFELSYFASRARREREQATRAADIRAQHVHQSLARNYVLRAMSTVLADIRGD
jgi:hypothetical protein